MEKNNGKEKRAREVQEEKANKGWKSALVGGLHSAAAIPIRLNGEIIGLLNLYATDGNCFIDEETQDMLKEIGTDISFAVDTIDVETKCKQALNALKHNEVLLNQTSELAKIGGWELDVQTMKLSWTSETYRIHELDSSIQPDLENAINYYAPEARSIIAEAVRMAIEEEKSFDLELPLITAAGHHIIVRSIGQSEYHDNKCERIYGVFQDISDSKQREKEIECQLQRLRALREIDLAIMGSTDVYLSLQVVLEHLLTQLQNGAADFLLLNPFTQTFEYIAGRGFHSREIEQSKLKIGQGVLGGEVLEQRVLHIPDLANAGDEFVRTSSIEGEGFVTYYAIPLISKGNVSGILEIFERQSFEQNQSWLDFLYALAGQAAIAVDNNRLFNGLQRSNQELLLAYDTTLEGWSQALDLRDKETEGHTLRVSEMTLKLAKAAGIADGELLNIRRGALLHDIGKMGIPDTILLKPDKLTDDEWVIMHKHPTITYNLLSPIAYLRSALDIPYNHHEKWDGTGYPRGIKGEQIPLSARLFAVVDVWDALRSDRPYRNAWPDEKVMEHIRSLSGTHFDPKAVELFLNVGR